LERPGTYYYTSGWLECATRRGAKGSIWTGVSLPANSGLNLKETYEEWARKFGEDQARYLLEESTRWMRSYTHGCLIDFDFLQHLDLDRAAQQICSEKGWTFEKIAGDLSLFQRMVDGPWPDSEFLIVHPGETITATGDDNIVGLEQESLTTDGLG
jgi:hypothetical protein